MPRTDPLPNWLGEDVYIIGGGPSLRRFDFRRLIGMNTIGCNEAFIYGASVVNICIWGDWKFWQARKDELAQYDGWVATNYDHVPNAPKWLCQFKREDDGLHKGGTLGWNANTGCAATNLALVLGAQRVFLLGFDMDNSMSKGPCPRVEGHWHDRELQAPATEDRFERFQCGFETAERHLPIVFPGREVWNVTDGTSELRAFPRKSFEAAGL